MVNITTVSTTNTRGMVKIGLGAAGSEVELFRVPSRIMNRAGPVSVFAPVGVPEGSRVSVAHVAESSWRRNIQVLGYPVADVGAPPFSFLDIGPFKYSIDADYARGVTIASGATADTKGPWVELSQDPSKNVIDGASLPHNYEHLGVCFIGPSNPDNAYVLVDIAVGAAGSEVVIAENLSLIDATVSGSGPGWPTIQWIAKSLAAGQRVSARTQASTGGKPIELLLAGLR